MSRKKMLVAEGFFDELEEELGAPIESIEITMREETTMWLCDYCDKEFETEKGASIHMKRWCKEKQIEDDWQEI